ncbi:glucose-1-phosphate adenylyltransferase family protein [Kocuria tytonis]|uniref:Glucose-1-phosphate adenylyltransferase n=1 Tax=Kocuria tytonis TaxID=2054280 RepID=A0A495AA27_9MICC|nr:sugar phosphate nucleotidyltransferase [Kocuria tytonis]RKQ36692.1 glucose-1-phosphate adenylyltransferase [Kocuria tytonis]
MERPTVLALVLAGGKGSRLGALTDHTVKPALPVGGTYRLIDISLSNLVHSHITDVWMVQQYLPHDLNFYMAGGRPWDLDRSHGGLHVLPPYQGADGEGFASGNSDSIFRQAELIREADPDLVLVLSADHLYTVDFRDVVDTHLTKRADLTMVTTQVSEDASRYSVVETDEAGTVTRFEYKPEEPTSSLVAGEMFLFATDVLLDSLTHLQQELGELGDYGEDLIPHVMEHHRVVEHRHLGYWMDLGTIQSFWTAQQQLLDGDGATLDDPAWPIWSGQAPLLPAFVADDAAVTRSLVAPGSHVAGTVEHSVIGENVTVEAGAVVRNCVLLDRVHVGPGVELVNVVADTGAHITGGSRRGSSQHVTVIDRSGAVADREPFDTSAALPRDWEQY